MTTSTRAAAVVRGAICALAALVATQAWAATFALGQRVKATATAQVRAIPSTTIAIITDTGGNNLLGSQVTGSLGSVVGGPKAADGQTWWRIDYDSGADGWSIESALQAAPADTTPPSVPAGLSATAVSPTQVNLKWTASVDGVAAGVVVHEVLRNGTLVATTTSTNYQDAGVSAGTAYTYTVGGRDIAGNRSAVSAPAAATTPATVAANPLDTLSPGTWLAVPSSNVGAVQFEWPAAVQWGTGPPRFLTESSGTYDSTRHRFIVWGGGHNDYAGNEIYTFDIDKLTWRRETEPTLLTDRFSTMESKGYYPDANGDIDPQQPRSRHSYDSLAYLPNVDRFCAFGFFAGYPASKGGMNTDCYDFTQRTWERRADIPSIGQSLVAMSAYDPATGGAFYYRGGSFLNAYNPVANTWTAYSTKRDDGYFYDATALIDTKRHRFVGMGLKYMFWYDLDAGPGKATQKWVLNTFPGKEVNVASGDTEILQARRPGFAYDPVNDVYVAWSGEYGDTNNDGQPEVVLPPENVWVIDPDTWVFKKIAPAAGNTAKPRSPFPLSNGFSNSTFGRFAYIPGKNVFILVNNYPSENVYFYKLDPASVRGNAPPPPPPAVFDFTLTAGAAVTVTAGQSVNASVSTTLVSGTSENVAFTLSGLPTGATATFGTAQCTPPCSIAVTLSTTSATPAGTYTLGLAANGGGASHTSTLNLTVQAVPVTPVDPPTSSASSSSAPAASSGGGGGCTLGAYGEPDPTLPLLMLAAAAVLRRRAVKRR